MPARRQPLDPLRLTSARIVETAIEIVRTEGYDALTMRQLAAALGTGQASLYAHVANKTELDRLIVTQVLLQLPEPDDSPQRWREALVDASMQLYRSAIEHPGLAGAYFGSAPDDARLVARAEIVLAMLRRAGLTPIEATAAEVAASLLPLARALEDAALHIRIVESGQTEGEWYAAIRSRFGALFPRTQYPAMTEMIDALYPEHRLEVFEEILALIVEGLDARLARRSSPTTSIET